MNEPVFATRALALVIGISVISFVVGVLLAVFGEDLIGIDSYGTDSYSHSAIGHRALVETLERLDIPVYVSTWESARRAGRDGVLLLLEPTRAENTRWQDTARSGIAERVAKARTTVIVLPKWTAREHDTESGWVGPVSQRNEWQILNTLRELGLGDITVVHPTDEPRQWRTGGFGPPPELRSAQLLRGDRLDPLIDCDDGILVGEIRVGAEPETLQNERNRVVFVSDPDLMSNHGLARASNAVLAVRLIDHLRLGGAVVVDETIHGHELKPSVYREAFRFPIALVPLQVVFCVLVLLWAGMGRFGSPRRPPPPLEPGNRFLIKNTAELLRVGGHSREMLGRYLDDTVMQVRQRLHVPDSVQGEALVDTLDRIGESRKVSTPYSVVAREVGEVLEQGGRRPERVVRAAARVNDWRQEILNGPGRGSQHS